MIKFDRHEVRSFFDSVPDTAGDLIRNGRGWMLSTDPQRAQDQINDLTVRINSQLAIKGSSEDTRRLDWLLNATDEQINRLREWTREEIDRVREECDCSHVF